MITYLWIRFITWFLDPYEGYKFPSDILNSGGFEDDACNSCCRYQWVGLSNVIDLSCSLKLSTEYFLCSWVSTNVFTSMENALLKCQIGVSYISSTRPLYDIITSERFLITYTCSFKAVYVDHMEVIW